MPLTDDEAVTLAEKILAMSFSSNGEGADVLEKGLDERAIVRYARANRRSSEQKRASCGKQLLSMIAGLELAYGNDNPIAQAVVDDYRFEVFQALLLLDEPTTKLLLKIIFRSPHYGRKALDMWMHSYKVLDDTSTSWAHFHRNKR